MKSPLLSKSQYCKGRKCLKRVWLYNHRRDLAQKPGDFQQQLFDQGHEVGRLAWQLFPDGVLISEDHRQRELALQHTQEALGAGAQVLFEAAVMFDGILIRIDILKINSDQSVDLIEVKSTNSVKKEHLDDLAVQKYVLTGAGFKVRTCSILHLNPKYVRQGDLDLQRLFVTEDMSQEIEESYSEVSDYVNLIRAHLVLEQEPPADIGSVCKNPYVCEFYEHCWNHVDEDSIHNLSRISSKKRSILTDMGIEKIHEIPESFELTEKQLIQRQCAISESSHIELSKIKKSTQELRWPLYFLDFETIQFAVPLMDGTSPYEHLTFQYSLHIQKEPGAGLIHKDFLSESLEDPRGPFVKHLCRDIPSDGGSVVVYYASFERSKIEKLAEIFPDHAETLKNISSRLWDLEVPFSKSWYYQHSFAGRSSIKKVLPALVPELSYEDLKVQKGDAAQARYLELIRAADVNFRETAALELKAYCHRDTWAMVQILRVLVELTGQPKAFPAALAGHKLKVA